MAQKKKKDVFATAKIEKRNVLNEIRNNSMSLQELRFFSIYLSKINARDISTRVVKFPIGDFQRIMGLQSMNYAQIRENFTHILQQVVSVPNENGRGFTSFQLFKRCKLYQEEETGEWYVEIDAHDDALPLMFEFKRNYFTYELWNALRLKSPNQIRMYEILKQYEKLFELDGMKLVVEDGVKELIVDTAIKNKLGARGLRSICEKIFDDAMYEAPSSRKKTFTVTLDYAKAHLENEI